MPGPGPGPGNDNRGQVLAAANERLKSSGDWLYQAARQQLIMTQKRVARSFKYGMLQKFFSEYEGRQQYNMHTE